MMIFSFINIHFLTLNTCMLYIYDHISPSLYRACLLNEDYRKKCDVYSFRVLALEVIKGKHPRGFVSSILPSPSVINMRLDEMLDPRLPPPSPDVQGKLISIMEVAFSCLDVSPESRPTMQTITQQLLFSLVYFSYAHP